MIGSFSRVGYAVRSRLGPWPDPPDQHGRVHLVTGASSGVGRAVALRLAGLGAEVWMAGRDAGAHRGECPHGACCRWTGGRRTRRRDRSRRRRGPLPAPCRATRPAPRARPRGRRADSRLPARRRRHRGDGFDRGGCPVSSDGRAGPPPDRRRRERGDGLLWRHVRRALRPGAPREPARRLRRRPHLRTRQARPGAVVPRVGPTPGSRGGGELRVPPRVGRHAGPHRGPPPLRPARTAVAQPGTGRRHPCLARRGRGPPGDRRGRTGHRGVLSRSAPAA